MNSRQRIGLLLAALAALAVAFFVLSPGETKNDTASTATQPSPSTQAPTTSTTGGYAAEPTPPAATQEPQFIVVRVRGGKPVGGVRTIKVTAGERVRIEVQSPDTSDEVHLHGYDIKRDLKAGGRVRFSFKADAEGIFEMELEGSRTPIAKIEVAPR
ncbi:MAG: hypothetical protein QOD83_4775 [Solirubrobacteraceae bacterium]|jgi:FtsP/CotA-like multicopper oxidase with cupredoxin domain|nr:hypothetical protein [Solirubrobacteraceae bacterium]